MDNNQKKDNKKEEERDCPLCNISEETLAKLKAADKNKEREKKSS